MSYNSDAPIYAHSGFRVIMAFLILIAICVGSLYLITRHNDEVGHNSMVIRQAEVDAIKSAMIEVEKNGRCYSIIVSRGYYGYPVVSHTWIPCNREQQREIENIVRE